MIIYIEYLTLINVLIHYISLYVSLKTNKQNNSNYKLFISILIVIFLTIINLYYNFHLLIKISFSIMILLPFMYKKSKNIIFNVFISYNVTNIIVAGLFELINSNKKTIIILTILSIIIVIEMLINKNKLELLKNDYYYEVIINNKKFKAFLDTGNFLKDEITDIPIIVLNNKYDLDMKKVDNLLVKSINETFSIDLYRPNKFIIIINNIKYEKEVFVTKSNINFDLLIGLELFK